MGVLPSTLFALLVLQTELIWGQGDGTRVIDGGSTSQATGASGQGTSSSSSGLSSSSSSGSSSSSRSSFDFGTSSGSTSSVSIPIGAILGGLFSLFSPPPSSRRTPVSRQTRPRRPNSARRQPATTRFQPTQRRQQQTSGRRFQAVQKSTPRRTRLSTVQQPTSSWRIQPIEMNQITAENLPSLAKSCSCNGMVTARGQGECKTLWHQDGVTKAFCYTDDGRCGDQQRSPSGRFWSFQACSGKDSSTNNLVTSSPRNIPVGYSPETDQSRDTQQTRSNYGQRWRGETASYPNVDQKQDMPIKSPIPFRDENTVSRSRTVSLSCSGLRPCRTPGGKCCKPLGYQGRPSCRRVTNC